MRRTRIWLAMAMTGAGDAGAWRRPRARLRDTAVAATLVAAALPGLLAAQAAAGPVRVSLGVEPARVTVGETFHAAVQVSAPQGFSVEYLDFAGNDSIQAIAPVEVARTDEGQTVGVYALAAWIAAPPPAAAVAVRLIGPDGTARVQQVNLRLPEILSVLPARDEEVVPRPARGLIVAAVLDAYPWWWWLALLLLALAAAAAAWWMLRRREAGEEVEPLGDPRGWALAQLDAPAARPLEGTEVYQRMSWVVRTYVWRVSPSLGRDLTTTELLRTMLGLGEERRVTEPLAALLAAADRVKFAGVEPLASAAQRDVEEARRWVTGYPAAEAPEGLEREGRVA
jgi:hypothetical protein